MAVFLAEVEVFSEKKFRKVLSHKNAKVEVEELLYQAHNRLNTRRVRRQ